LRFSGVPSAATRGVVVSDIFYPKIKWVREILAHPNSD